MYDQPVDSSSYPSQLLTLKVLRRPLESTIYIVVARPRYRPELALGERVQTGKSIGWADVDPGTDPESSQPAHRRVDHNPLASKDIRRLVGLARVVALDGERRLIRNDNAYVDVAPGAFLLSVSKTLAANPQTGGKNSSFGPRTGGHHD